MSPGELRQRIDRTSIFARVLPEQKRRLVEAFKASGEGVAMTGGGVNDAPPPGARDILVSLLQGGAVLFRPGHPGIAQSPRPPAAPLVTEFEPAPRRL
jgi:Ca2+-transporting ATPase